MEAQINRERDRQEILEHIHSIFRAFAARDREKLRQTHLSEFKGYAARSRSTIRNRDMYLRDVESILENQEYQDYVLMEEDFHFIGEVAIVCYIANVTGRTRQGQPYESKIRVMDIYRKTGEGWNLAASSVSLHPDVIDRHLSTALAAGQKS